MARKARELGSLAISRIGTPGVYAVGGVSGLSLQVSAGGGRSWLLRYSIGTKRRAFGLGSFPDVTVATARTAAREARKQIREGIDPIDARKAQRSALAAAQGKVMTFKQCAEAYIAAHEAGWRNAKHRQQWANSLATFAYPKIGHLLVSDVEQSHVMQILEPIWSSHTETAKRLRGRIENVLAWAIGRKLRTGDNPARWKGLLQTQLASPNKIKKTKHHPAVPVTDIGKFAKRLRDIEGTGARALEFAILTAARSGEVRGATWSEIDLEGKLWTIPAERMKANKEHQVPLSSAALKILEGLPRMAGTELLFPSRNGKQLSDMTLTAVMRRMNESAVPHGFRSTFRDWAGAMTSYPREAAEFALAHGLRDKTEASYFRDNLLAKRKSMMEDWAAFCAKEESATVVSISQARVTA